MKKGIAVLVAMVIGGSAWAAAIAPTSINGAPKFVEWAAAIDDTLSPPSQANILTAPFSAESTGVLATGDLESCFLRFQVWPAAGDTTLVYRFEIRIKALRSSTVDTLTASTWNRYQLGGSGQDSSATFYGALTGTHGRQLTVNVDPKSYLPSAFRSWMGGSTHWVPLWGPRGDAMAAPFSQIVVRCTGDLGAGKPKVRLDVIGKKAR